MPVHHNWLLAALPPDQWPHPIKMERRDFPIGHVAVDPGTPASHFWFVESGFLSITKLMEDGKSVEIAYVGGNGVMPILALWDDGPIDLKYVVQQPTTAWLAPAEEVRRAVVRGATGRGQGRGELRRLFGLACGKGYKIVTIVSACNRAHGDEQRIVRRLLAMTTDHEPIPTTLEFLGELVGITRQNTGKVSRGLAAAGLIRHQRGSIAILDREGLNARACSCYREIEAIRLQT